MVLKDNNPADWIEAFAEACPIDGRPLNTVDSSADERTPDKREHLRARVDAACEECGGIWALFCSTDLQEWRFGYVIEKPTIPEGFLEEQRNIKLNTGGYEWVSCPTCGSWTCIGSSAFPDGYLHLKTRDGDFYVCDICGGHYVISGSGYGKREAVLPEGAPARQLPLFAMEGG